MDGQPETRMSLREPLETAGSFAKRDGRRGNGRFILHKWRRRESPTEWSTAPRRPMTSFTSMETAGVEPASYGAKSRPLHA